MAAIDRAKVGARAAALNILASPVLFGNRQIIMKHVALAISDHVSMTRKGHAPDGT